MNLKRISYLLLFSVLIVFCSIPAMAQKKKTAKKKNVEGPKSANEYFALASQKAKAGKYQDAVLLFDKGIALDNTGYDVFYNRGYCKVHLHDYEAAIPDFTQAIKLRKKVFPNGLYYRGYCYNQLGMYNLAIPDFSKALEVTANADLWSARGFAYLQSKEYENALSDYTYAIAMDKKSIEYVGSRAICNYNLHHLQDAVDDAEKFLAKKPNSPDIIEIEFRAKYELKDYDGALVLASKLVEMRQTPLTYYFKGMTEYYMNKFAEGISDFTLALKIDSTYRDAYYCRSLCFLGLNDDEHACKDLRKAEAMGYPGLKGKIESYCKDIKQ